ncbi:glycine-rich protein, putative [Trichomonas vaginalis G3]|uniref:receptor protein-tyrosine kinase n=1 Tax=Trichomonas vaginalis (strain ATCC PRA-98 / G3) TaxID=412133 RepID=A2F2W3_TRIV3|nr:glycine-rich protein family [Trichomonas vaginalis G3]EAY00756.1 glycine-rich protein, putative [Trichomonas vaginalis G3]KAI5530740.1 glycine-rich protein family [Trichomonas vaginalis G3]|eukprot:XP_001313685.1 glycine-rich protein [Trichomonas vaginalis G3]
MKGGYGGKIAGNGEGSDGYFGMGATISSPGRGGKYPGNQNPYYPSCDAESGTFLKGGNACSTATVASGGGGSGYYGGGGGADQAAGGGGSSFASNFLKNVIFKNGNEEFIQPDGSTKIGHSGDGFVSIEKLSALTIQCNYNNYSLLSVINMFSLIFISSE